MAEYHYDQIPTIRVHKYQESYRSDTRNVNVDNNSGNYEYCEYFLSVFIYLQYLKVAPNRASLPSTSQTFTASHPPFKLDLKSKRAGSNTLYLQICQVILLPHPLIPLSDPSHPSHGSYENSRLHGSVLLQCATYQPGCFRFDNHVLCCGPCPVLPRHLPRFLYWPIIFLWPINLDALEGYLCMVAEEDLCEIDKGYGGQVQAKGAFLCIAILAKCSPILS
jgi:hypothetical protein